MTLEKGWHPDPTGRHEQRLWNGTRWTSQVHSNGVTLNDPYTEPSPEPEPAPEPYEVYVRQRMTLGVTAYDYLDARGRTVLRIGQVRQSRAARAERLLRPNDNDGRHEFEVRDASTKHLLTLVRPEDTDRLEVSRPDGSPVGEIDAERKTALVLRADGAVVGHVRRSRRAGTAFDVLDAADAVVGRLHKELGGLLKEFFTVSDEYALSLDEPMAEPLRTLALMAPVALDEAHFEFAWDSAVNGLSWRLT